MDKKSRDRIFSQIKHKNSAFWSQTQMDESLKQFHYAAEHVSAYKKFLKKRNIDPKKVKSYADFKQLPATNKENYLTQFPLDEVTVKDGFKDTLVYTSTSGSTGDPYYFSRNPRIDWQSSIVHELYITDSTLKKNEPTLVVVCFGMGVWIGGLITYQAFQFLGTRGYPISIITPGINKEEIFKALKRLGPSYKQVILVGYPPFIKGIVDEAEERKVSLKKMNVHLLFAAEAFTEKFRDYMGKKAHVKDVLRDTSNIYGSADIGSMAFETPLSILIRRLAMRHKELFEDIFSKITKTPTLAQYIPSFINFEEDQGELFLTGSSSIPLIRYGIGDNGGVHTFKEMEIKLAAHGFNLKEECRKAGISNAVYELPFVYVYERKDMSTTLYGLQIFPETIREVLLETPFSNFLTGKFTLVTKYDMHQNQYLEINLESRKSNGISMTIKKYLLNAIVENLLQKNGEFRELHKHIKNKAFPKLVFWQNEDPLYFKPGIKQKWVKK